MSSTGSARPRVFISYVKENREAVGRLVQDLRDAGFEVWWDQDIPGGCLWRDWIAEHISRDDFFVPCFSTNVEARHQTYFYEELNQAIGRMRQMPPSRVWLMPVRLDECSYCDTEVTRGRRLSDYQWTDVFSQGWNDGVARLVTWLRHAVSEQAPELLPQRRAEITTGDRTTAPVGGVYDLLAGRGDPDSALGRFMVHLGRRDLLACEHMREAHEVELPEDTEDPDVAAAGAQYCALRGDNAGFSRWAERLLALARNGPTLRLAAGCAQVLAERRRRGLADRYRLGIGCPVFFDDQGLLDTDLLGTAVDWLREEALWWKSAGEDARATTAAELAVGLSYVREAPPPDEMMGLAARGRDAQFTEWPPPEPKNDAEREAWLNSATRQVGTRAAYQDVADVLLGSRGWLLSSGEASIHIRFWYGLLSVAWQAWQAGTPVMRGGTVFGPLDVLPMVVLPPRYEWYVQLFGCKVSVASTPPDLDAAEVALERAREMNDEDNPELLAAACAIAGLKGETGRRVEFAQRLRDVAPTRQTWGGLLTALHADGQWERLLQELDSAPKAMWAGEGEAYCRNVRANALLQLARDQEALDDLEWLAELAERDPQARGHSVADAIVNLAFIRTREGKYAEARRALELGHKVFGASDSRYIRFLAETLRMEGKPDEAWQRLSAELDHYTEDGWFLGALCLLAHATGHEATEECQRAMGLFGELPPGEYGGRFVAQGDSVPDEVRQILEGRAHEFQVAEQLYQNATMPFVAFAAHPTVNRAACELWWWMGRTRIPRYVGILGQDEEAEWLAGHRPTAAVIDWTTLSLLDELLRGEPDDAVRFAGRSFEKLYVPATLRVWLERERHALLAVQPERETASEEILRELQGSGKLSIVPALPEADHGGDLAARRFAAEHDLHYVTAYDHRTDPPARSVSVLAFAAWLCSAGPMPQTVVERLKRVPLERQNGMPPDWGRLMVGREFVIDGWALHLLQQAGGLEQVLEWAKAVHVPEASRAELAEWAEQHAWREQATGRLEALKAALTAPNSRVEWVNLSQSERVVRFGEDQQDEMGLAWAYFADLFNVALKTGAPLWTDDRATRSLREPEHPVRTFGTDVLLKHARSAGKLDEAEWDAHTEGLLRAGYRSILPDPDFLLYLVSKGVAP